MFRFESYTYLYILSIIPLLILLYFYVKQRHIVRLKRFGNLETISSLMPEAAWSKVRFKYILLITSIALLVVALARPQMGSKLREVKRVGAEIVLVVDVSNSMLAEDLSPSRLERTKYAISRLSEQLVNDRLGLVVFAGDAFVQLPVTSDFVSAKSFVNHISPSMIANQGTNIAKALEVAGRSFSSESDKNRSIILISDGEEHDGNALAIADVIGKSGTKINVIGIGSPEGAPITINGEMIKDEGGNIVVSRLNEEMLKNMAISTGGSYIRATSQAFGMDEILKQIRELESKEFSSSVYDEYNEQFVYILALVLMILILEFVILERKNRFIARLTLFNREEKKEKKI